MVLRDNRTFEMTGHRNNRNSNYLFFKTLYPHLEITVPPAGTFPSHVQSPGAPQRTYLLNMSITLSSKTV